MKLLLALSALLLFACQPSMNHQPKFGPATASPFFADGAAARPLPHGVVAYAPTAARPAEAPLSLALLRRGEARYKIYCSACHGLDGAGGLAGLRGFSEIPSLQSAHAFSLTPAAVEVIVKNGQGRMYGMGATILPEDIHAIALFLGALQLSQHAKAAELTPADRAALEESRP